MIIITVCGIVAVVLVLILFLQYVEQNVPAVKEVPQLMAKEVIMAMAQQPLSAESSPKYEDDVQWVRRFTSNTCATLNFVSRGLKLKELVDRFCDQIDSILDFYEANMLEYEKRLSAISDIRKSFEKELEKSLKANAKSVVETSNDDGEGIMVQADCHRVQLNSSLQPVEERAAIEVCSDVIDDDECFAEAFGRLVYSTNVIK